MSAPPLRIGLVGCGRLAELGYVPAFSRAEEVVLAAVADPVAGRRDRIAGMAAARGVRPTSHAGAGELLAASDVEALVIASPPVEHLRQAQLAAGAGLPTLVEKPPALAGAGAEQLAALRPAPWIGFNRRFQHGGGHARAAARRRRARARAPARLPAPILAAADRRRGRAHRHRARTSSTWRWCSRARTAPR